MFFLIRFIAIVGVIFHFSPERDRPDGRDMSAQALFEMPLRLGMAGGGPSDAHTQPRSSVSMDQDPADPDAAAIWRAIPDAARDRLTREIARQLVEEGIGLRATLGVGEESAGMPHEDAR